MYIFVFAGTAQLDTSAQKKQLDDDYRGLGQPRCVPGIKSCQSAGSDKKKCANRNNPTTHSRSTALLYNYKRQCDGPRRDRYF